MNSEEVSAIIFSELEDEPALTNINGHDLSAWAHMPILREYRARSQGHVLGIFWIVFAEKGDGSGYYIFFDEQSASFGLALKDMDGRMVRIGTCGSFLKALRTI